MPVSKIPIWLGSNRSVDEYGLGGLSAELRDAFIDDLNNVRKRPGILAAVPLGTDASVDGLYWWEKQNCLIAVSNQNIYQITWNSEDGYNSSQYSYAAAEKLEVGNRVVFADFGSVLYAANGGKIFKIPASTASSVAALADTDAPTAVTHIAYFDTYLICNNTAAGHQSEFYWSSVLDPDSWQGEFATAEAHVDDLKALAVSNKMLFLLGTRSVEVWYNDGVTPFVPLSQGVVQVGTIAPNSFQWCKDSFYWISENRELVRLVGNKVQRLPVQREQSLAQYLQSLSIVSDAEASYIAVGGREFYVLQLPTEDETIVYDIGNNTWLFWSTYASVDGTYSRWFGDCLANADLWNKRLLGHKANGYIYEFSSSYVSDGAQGATYLLDQNNEQILGVDGSPIIVSYGTGGTTEPIRTLIRTGQIDHDTQTVKKTSSKYTLLCKRTGAVTGIDGLSVRMRWRDDGADSWGSWKGGSVQNIDDSTFRLSWRRNGEYFTRQLEIVNADPAPLLIVSLEEKFTFGV
jgi:hypothetical protein